MIIGIPKDHNVVAGRSQGYLGLPLRLETQRTALKDGREFDSPAMITRWMPTKEERAAIAAGADIYVRILGDTPPPMMVGVGDPSENGW